MNILFLTLLDFISIDEHGVYPDLLREFAKSGHMVCAISPIERRRKQKTYLIESDNVKILKLKTGNITKCNLIEKGLSTLSIESIFILGIKQYFSNIKFDLVLYSTPPITFCNAIQYVKKRDNAITYLMLKDIFPQNAVDLGMLSTMGVKGILYKYFRGKEKQLYQISDYIGCMSQMNMEYILKHNLEINPSKVEICSNAIEVIDMSISQKEIGIMRNKYGIPLDKTVFVYGGNLGKPQGIDFMIECLRSQKNNKNIFFLIVGSGTEYGKIEKFINEENQENIKLMKQLPKNDYDKMIISCDIGMIFLDHRFTIPNFPSRLLAYMQAKLPVLAITDVNTDLGKIIIEGGFGWWCESNSIRQFEQMINQIMNLNIEDLLQMKNKEIQYLKDNYSSENVYEIIMTKVR